MSTLKAAALVALLAASWLALVVWAFGGIDQAVMGLAVLGLACL
jgi:hypothetical protein